MREKDTAGLGPEINYPRALFGMFCYIIFWKRTLRAWQELTCAGLGHAPLLPTFLSLRYMMAPFYFVEKRGHHVTSEQYFSTLLLGMRSAQRDPTSDQPHPWQGLAVGVHG